jgi:hypothetical protein
MTSSINDLMSEVRDFVNTTWKHYQLRQNGTLFSQLVSALDTIEDAEEAIAAFEADPIDETTGILYLITYGIFQAFFLQQDAIRHLSEALGIPDTSSKYPKLHVIKEIRNDSVGHPTKRNEKKGKITSHHHISRMTMSKKGFQLLSYYSDGTSLHRDISIPNLITVQRKYVTEMLKDIIVELKSETKKHKEQFQMEKLALIFHPTLNYSFEKVGAAFTSGPVELGIGMLADIKTTLHKFHDAVGRRNMDAFTQLEDDFKYIDHAISQLERLLTAHVKGKNRPEDELDGKIYLSFLRSQTEWLEKYAKEIDAEYAQS